MLPTALVLESKHTTAWLPLRITTIPVEGTAPAQIPLSGPASAEIPLWGPASREMPVGRVA